MLRPETKLTPNTSKHSEVEFADKWFQRISTYAGLPAGVLMVIFNQKYLAIACFLWLTVAVVYSFFKQQRRRDAELQELGLASLGTGYKPQRTTLQESPPEGRLDSQPPAPNIICLPEDRLFVVELGRHQVFRESNYHGAGALRPVAAAFTNAPNPPRKVGRAENVTAQIEFYSPDWPDRELYRINHACWLNEESPYVTFELGTVHHLILGVFQHKQDRRGGFESDFIIFGNSPDRNARLTEYRDRITKNFKIKIRLLVGEHGEHTSEYDFELQHNIGSSFIFAYISEEEKSARRAYFNEEVIKLIAKGETFVTTPLINVEWDNLYADIHQWFSEVFTLIHRHYGRPPQIQFTNVSNLKPYPHKISEGHQRFFDELYTKLENLKEIAREFGAPVSATDVAQQIQEVTDKRREQILKDLAKFSEEATALLDYEQIRRLSEYERNLYIWDGEIFNYLSQYLDRADAVLISNDTLEPHALPEDIPAVYHDFLMRVNSRLLRLNRLIGNIESGQRAV